MLTPSRKGTMEDSDDPGAEAIERYFEVDFEPSEALSFERPTDTAIKELSELLRRLPIRSIVHDPLGQDTLQNASLVGAIDEVMLVLKRDLRADYEENRRELDETCEFRTFAVETNTHPDALHIVTRLLAKDGSGRAIVYGSRVQRIGDDAFALWSEHG
jgi:hypothetical protein